MSALLSLWLPILLTAVAVFVVSCMIHMVFKWHAPDYKGLDNEDAVRAALRTKLPGPGRYVIPYCPDMKAMGSEEMRRKYEEGPVGQLLLAGNGMPNIGKSLGLWFVWSLVVAAFCAGLALCVLGSAPGQQFTAAKFVGTLSFVAYGFGTVQESIWMLRPWSSSAKHLLDASLYGLGSGLVFYWLWP